MKRRRWGFILFFFVFLSCSQVPKVKKEGRPQLLTDPFLQMENDHSVSVVWFTEWRGTSHEVVIGPSNESLKAITIRMSRLRKDSLQHPIWRHEVKIPKSIRTHISSKNRIPYYVRSSHEDGEIQSEHFSIPTRFKKILISSDHQLKPMVAANLQKAVETVGTVDAVFFAGDLVNIPDRSLEWFGDNEASEGNNSFFPTFQGNASYRLNGTLYRGGAILQHAPLFTAIGNHEVMGRFHPTAPLGEQFVDAVPHTSNSGGSGYNTVSYQELFTLPQGPKGEKYYSIRLGDVYLISLYATRILRPDDPDDSVNQGRGRYEDRNSTKRGYGSHIFEPIKKGSEQYQWMTRIFRQPSFQSAPIKILMLHHPIHTLGKNSWPPFTDPVENRLAKNTVRYHYPEEKDYLIRDIMPLVEKHQVNLVLNGHSHIWNRFHHNGVHYLESSNVGNSYGIRSRRTTYGLKPIIPNKNPIRNSRGESLPFLASNKITVFSILDVLNRTIRSYYFDTSKPKSKVVLLDELKL